MSTHHGNTPAAWTGVGIVLVGFTLGGIGLVVGSMALFWAGVLCAPLGGIVGLAMAKLGMGGDPVRR